MEEMEMIQSVSEELLPGVPKQRKNASHQSLKLDKAYIHAQRETSLVNKVFHTSSH